jgi:hypothetical protein
MGDAIRADGGARSTVDCRHECSAGSATGQSRGAGQQAALRVHPRRRRKSRSAAVQASGRIWCTMW